MYMRATQSEPYMGLNNTICSRPKYWCRLHQVWLSDEDVKTKKCKCKLSYDMMSISPCNCLEKKVILNNLTS